MTISVFGRSNPSPARARLAGSAPSALLAIAPLVICLALSPVAAQAQEQPAAPNTVGTAPDGSKTHGGQEATKDDLGKYTLPDGSPTYHITSDGTLDWYAYSGYRRYHAECHVCHGPDGMGSTYAPALANSLKNLTYEQFTEIVVNGKKTVGVGTADQVMPAFGENLNVMCYLDDLYVYLKARADGAMDRTRPSKREDKTKAYGDNENQCFGRN
ncbi:c-type cytochrome, methanol metabolism-related [Ancylobacter oerskovii]|uniref:C-type cytochrome, methanol metabolism-related n=1 Tax=Ancylobacter oerskovii TaxID=459519 RepID=A0ABW4Z2B0_9HYPH|nr:c-type cytochrome, methanol metabolism-related [Ancylobacter oerskovii]MBS7544912.1 c-type cytochrome, methanol metabolism-related [Ancylobacter oerskovii]